MTTEIEVTIGGLSKGLDELARDWPNLRRDALEGAILHSGLLEGIWMRTPKSLMQRYAERVSTGPVGDDGQLPRGWRRKLSPKALARVEKYGQERLARSLMPNGNRPGMMGTGLDIHTTSDGAVWRIRSSLVYAARMHEAKKPSEGHYWSPGVNRGWTTPETGNKFLSKPAEQYAGAIARELAKNLSAAIEGRFR